ncbi:MAG TPA: hypothetical protein VFQ77_09765 [Pseudonocardiaceae bacterium]|nr:hypothetical protein [Pseudonocardiaceae bacterium]
MKLLDVTLRDGGFVNEFTLDHAAALRIIALLDGAELDAMEIGYLTGLPPNHGYYPAPGICYAWTPEQIAEVVSTVTTPLVGMLHPGGPVPLNLHELAQSGLALVRIPVTPGVQSNWRDFADSLGAAGLRFTVNLTLATWSTPETVAECAGAAEQAGADVFYIADTNSAFLPHRVERLFRQISAAVRIPLGFHAHDGKRLAHANVLAAVHGGASWADASLGGLGRGMGNAATEVLHEITGRRQGGRYRLLRALPEIALAFGVDRTEQLWQQLCAFMDIWPPTIEVFERAEVELGIDKYTLVVNRVLGRPLARPPRETDLREIMGLGMPDIRLDTADQLH